MTLCDSLETELAKKQAVCSHLLESILDRFFVVRTSPGDSQEWPGMALNNAAEHEENDAVAI